MDFAETVRSVLTASDFIVQSYLGDVTDAELLERPAADANHIAWQLGHLISAEARLVGAAAPAFAFELPEGFAERHVTATATSNNPADFLTKDAYLQLSREVRLNTLRALETISDKDADKPVTGRLPPFVTRVGDAFALIGPHWIGHAGQWAVLRRKLGRERKF
jgi:hypothetical protein